MTLFSSLYSARLDRELGTDDSTVLFTTARRKAAINEGQAEFADLTECLRAPLNEALSILSHHEAFIYEGPAYKGISLANGAGQFRLHWMQPGCLYTSPHWCSATCLEEANYASDRPMLPSATRLDHCC